MPVIILLISSFSYQPEYAKFDKMLHKRLISLSEISQLTRHLICERGNFPKHSYVKMEIDRH